MSPNGWIPESYSEGAAALLVVMGISIALLLAATMVGTQSRQELRMAGAETVARKAQMQVAGAFAEIAAQARNEEYVPTDDGTTWCTPTGGWPASCTQVLAGRRTGIPGGDWEQLPVRVVWQAEESGTPQAFYGWVMRHWAEDTSQIPSVYFVDKVEVVYYRFWCPPGPAEPDLGPCKQGG